MLEITVRKGTKADFIKLTELDYGNSESKMFNITLEETIISLSEIVLPEPQVNLSKGYQDEIENEVIPMLENAVAVPLVAYVDNEPVAYLMAFWKNSPKGKALVIHGILVSKSYLEMGIGSKMLKELIHIAEKDKNCKGIFAEMGTDKYSASKLLQKMGFIFSGAEAFVYSNDFPTKYSKETIYFCYRT